MAKLRLAFDESVRRYDPTSGHLHIKVANISKAAVNPYKGDEIPGWKQLGLDADKVYKLLRDPDELELGAGSFAGKPLLIIHKPVRAEDHPYEEVIGAVGTDAHWDSPFVRAGLTVWPDKAIKLIQKAEQRELSCGYLYTPDMTPGIWPDTGERYDGVMRDIVGNHVALVEEGRAGSDVIIGDSAKEINKMNAMTRKAVLVSGVNGAVRGYVMPLLAQDKKMPDLKKVLAGLTLDNYKKQVPGVVASVTGSLKGRLKRGVAMDASAKGLKAVLDALEPDMEPESKEGPTDTEKGEKEDAGAVKGEKDEEDADKDTSTGDAEEDNLNDNPAEGGGENSMAAFKEWCKEKLGEDGFAEMESKLKAMKEAKGSGEEDKSDDSDKDDKSEAEDDVDAMDKDDDKGEKDMPGARDEEVITKPAMDAAIRRVAKDVAVTVTERLTRAARELREAERFVKPYVGELTMSYDTAEKVLRAAAKLRGVKNWDKVHVEALRPIIESLPTQAVLNRPVVNGRGDYVSSSLAMDSASSDEFEEMFGNV